MGFFGGDTKRAVGVDIGTGSIKLVQLFLDGPKMKLETYGEVWATSSGEEGSVPIFSLSNDEIGSMILELIKATKAKPENVTIAVPIFSSFVTLMELPVMSDKELADAVPFQARKYVPVPIEDVTLDFSISGRKKIDKDAEMLEVLLVAIPNEVVARYLNIAKAAQLELKALESESFGLARSIVGKDKNSFCLVDIGSSSTDITVVDDGTVKIAHNFDVAGSRLSGAISRSLQISYDRAEALKQERGLNPRAGEKNISEILVPLVDLITDEVSRVMNDYAGRTNRRIAKVVLSGGNSRIPGMAEYFAKKLSVPTLVAQPFANLNYPPSLDQKLKVLGPSYTVTIGTAMRHFT
ncbi:type IV pilus assembly protein PilM [Candidatus Parcubacteria bacterium]|nr:MAG: type IV pilus assembly protein PilM [Candidatus Parcubacteria bacterium]